MTFLASYYHCVDQAYDGPGLEENVSNRQSRGQKKWDGKDSWADISKIYPAYSRDNH